MFFLINDIPGDLRYSSLVILSSIESKVLTPIITNTHVKILSEFKIPEGGKGICVLIAVCLVHCR